MENLTTEEKTLYKKLERNRKAREAYDLATKEGRNKKLVNISGISKRGRKNKKDNNIINYDVKELSDAEKIFKEIRDHNRKNKYK
jgi:hypothetical protein